MPPISTSGKNGPSIRIVANQRDFNAAIKYLQKHQGAYASKYVQNVVYAAAKIPVGRMKAVVPVVSGDLRRSIRARRNKLEIKEMAASTVGPDPRRKGRHRVLYILGTKPHGLEGGSSGRAGKKKYSAFPDRGVPYNLKKVEFVGPVRYKEQVKNGYRFVAYNPWIQHPGSRAHGQLEFVWNANRANIDAFVQTQVFKIGEGGFKGFGVTVQ
jgi:hypothetical protein